MALNLERQLADPRCGEALDLRATERLIVTFGSLKIDGGIAAWNFVRATQGAAYSRIFLRDEQMAWYQRGTREHASVESLTAWLRSVAARYRSVLFAGSSMGGYAALHYGRAVGVDVYAVNPQTSLAIERAEPYPDPRRHVPLDRLLADPPPDALLDLRDTRQDRGRSVIHYAAQSAIDVAHAANMAGRPGIELVPHRHRDHLLVKALTRSGDVGRVLAGVQALA